MSFRYEKEYTAEISFPLGGIGSGSIGISGTGRLIDWEILNRPNKNSVNGFSHIAVKAIKDGRVVDARVLNGDWVGEMTGKYDMDGVLEGRQHHTLDMELFGPSSWLQGLYVCALKAMYEMAKIMKDGDADTYNDLYIKGKKFLNTELFNGEYYFQKIDINDKNVLIPYEDAAEKYWNEECSQIKYQIGGGCEIDQALAQWHSVLCGLGEIYDKSKIKSALSALYKNNFKQNMRNFYNPWRVFCVDNERGAVMCDYPKGAVKPIVPLPYCQETMHGFEYALAGLMIEEGMAEQGFEIVKAIRDRYDGKRRNPWNEISAEATMRGQWQYLRWLSFSAIQL